MNLAIFFDTEWGYRSGRIGCESALVPAVSCALDSSSGQEHVFLPGEGDQGLSDFIVENKDALFVAHSVTAEMKYLLRLRLPIPERWYDTLLAERWLVNSPDRQKVSLVKALDRYGLSHLAPIEKEEMRQKILLLNFNPNDSDEMAGIADYCMQDCRATAALFQRQRADPKDAARLDTLMPWWSIYLLTVAKMELRGIPIDMEIYKKLVGHWPDIRKMLADEINAEAPVMTMSGINPEAFWKFCIEAELPLPRLYDKAKRLKRYSIANEPLKEIEHYHPLIPRIRETQKTLAAIKSNHMVVDEYTGRHHFSVMPFGTITGRNASKQCIFSLAKWYRYLMVPESPDHVLTYIDFSAQEIGIAAALSQDPAMIAMYQAEDPHMAFAELAGSVPEGAGKDEYPQIRKKYKTVNLGVLYGLTPEGTKLRLGISMNEANELHRIHERLFPMYWDWSRLRVVTAMNRGSIRTRQGWRCWVPLKSKPRTWANWPMQAAGADIMRITMMYMDRAGLSLLAPVHDGFLLSCHRQDLPRLQQDVDSACGMAVEHVLPGFTLRWTTTIYEQRFDDPDGLPLWEMVQRLLRNITV